MNTRFEDQQVLQKIFISDNEHLNILGLDLIEKFGLASRAMNSFCIHVSTTFPIRSDVKEISSFYANAFAPDLGTCKFVKAQLRLTTHAKPIFRQKRPVPYAVKEPLDKQIDRLLEAGIIRPTSYSSWAAPIVVVNKPTDAIRLFADFSTGLNQALETHQYPLPLIEDLLTSLNGGILFSQLDLADAYLQIEMEEQSKELVTIHTHRGLFQYNRLPFGVKTAPGIFQQVMDH